MRNIIRIAYYVLVFSFIAACSSGNGNKTSKTQSNSSKRLVVTNSDALEMLLELGAQDNIVGIGDTKMKTFSEQIKRWPLVGKWRNPNIEAIVNLKPDIVVTYKQWPDNKGFDDKLSPFNITVERLDCYNISEFTNDVRRLASFTGTESKADTIINNFNDVIKLISDQTKGIAVKKNVYFEFSDYTALGIGTGSNEILTLANVNNIASELKISYPKISTEWLLEEDPDVIIKTITSDTLTTEQYDNLINRPGWNKLKAVKNKNVFLISNEICSGPRAMIGALFIAKWCYPEKFSSVNPDSVHIKWLQKYHGVTSNNTFVLARNK
jgi:iron complex transport system substrate-binding protein